jgi:hypothetical protein
MGEKERRRKEDSSMGSKRKRGRTGRDRKGEKIEKEWEKEGERERAREGGRKRVLRQR